MKRAILVTAVLVSCCVLSGCEFFCACAMVLTFAATKAYGRSPTGQQSQNPSLLWLAVFEDCANGQNTQEADVCPWDGQWTSDLGETYVSCIPGTVDPWLPSLVPTEASDLPGPTSGRQAVVESAPFDLPQGPAGAGGCGFQDRCAQCHVRCEAPSVR